MVYQTKWCLRHRVGTAPSLDCLLACRWMVWRLRWKPWPCRLNMTGDCLRMPHKTKPMVLVGCQFSEMFCYFCTIRWFSALSCATLISFASAFADSSSPPSIPLRSAFTPPSICLTNLLLQPPPKYNLWLKTGASYFVQSPLSLFKRDLDLRDSDLLIAATAFGPHLDEAKTRQLRLKVRPLFEQPMGKKGLATAITTKSTISGQFAFTYSVRKN